MRFKKLTAFVLTISIVSTLFGISVSASPQGRQSTPLEGAVGETPAEHLFEYEGKKFILLDTEQKEGKKYFFVLCEDVYGTHQYDTDGIAYWEPTSQNNMAYWLNNDFLSNGNGAGNVLPRGIVNYLDNNRVWSTEEIKSLDGYKDALNLTTHPLALISSTEWKKYYKKIGQNVGGRWFFRSARSSDLSNGSINQILFTGYTCTVGTNNAWTVSGSACYIRPCFYLSEDFFKNCKLTSAGKSVQDAIADVLDVNIYTQQELIDCMTAPVASNVHISEEPVVGETISVEYTYNGMYPFDGAEYVWYESETISGPFTPIANATGKEFVVTEAQADKYIKVSVLPKCTSPFVKEGAECLSESAYGPVLGAMAIIQALSDTKSCGVENILLKVEEHNNLFKVNTTYSEIGVAAEDKNSFAEILYGMEYNSLQGLRTSYYQAAALVRLNAETDIANVDDKLKDAELKLDTSRYEKLDDTSYVDAAVYSKAFNSYATFKTTYFKALAVADINENDRSTIKELLLYYGEYLDADLTSVSDYQLGIIGTEVLKQRYADFDALNLAVRNAAMISGNIQEPIKQERPDIKEEKEAMGFTNNGIPSIAYRNENALKIEQEDNTDIPFSDIHEASWAMDSIMYLYDRGIISGYDDGTVKPAKTLLREEFVKMVVDAFVPENETTNTSFNDVDEGAWYAPYVKRGVSKGLISGIGNGNFGIGMTVTRQDMAVILYRLLNETKSLPIKTFADDDAVGDYAKDAVSKMAGIGLINGFEDGTFNPNAEATRAMAAKVICDMLVYLNK